MPKSWVTAWYWIQAGKILYEKTNRQPSQTAIDGGERTPLGASLSPSARQFQGGEAAGTHRECTGSHFHRGLWIQAENLHSRSMTPDGPSAAPQAYHWL